MSRNFGLSLLATTILSFQLIACFDCSAQGVLPPFGQPNPGVEYIGEPPVAPKIQQPTPASEELPAPRVNPAPVVRPAAPAGPLPTKRPASLGIIAEERTGNGRGLTVITVTQGSAADRAGVREGDILTALGSRPTNSVEDVRGALETLGAGDAVTIEISRNGELYELRASLEGSAPPAVAPSNERSGVIPQPQAGDWMRTPEAADGPSHGLLGVTVEDAAGAPAGLPLQRGAKVVAVSPGSPAEQGGITEGSTVVSIDNRVIRDAQELIRFMLTTRPGQEIEIGFEQNGILKRGRVVLRGNTQPRTSPLPQSDTPIADDGTRQRRIVIGGGNVGQILEGVGRTIDNILGSRKEPVQPQPQLPPAVRRVPTPPELVPQRVETAPRGGNRSEVQSLQDQVKMLMQRIDSLEKQLDQKNNSSKRPL